MFFRTPRFIRRWVRKRMHPMAEHEAWTGRQKLSLMYNFFAWNAFGLVLYQLYKGNKSWPVTEGLISKEEQEMRRPAYDWAQTLGIKKAAVYRVSHQGIGNKEEIEVAELKDKTSQLNEAEESL